MRTIYVLAGMLLCGTPVFAQGGKNPVSADTKGQAALPVAPTLPGEEKLSARERAERDFLMPIRRKQAAALKDAAQEEVATQAAATTAEMTARNFIGPEEAKVEEAAAPAKPTARPRTYHRRSSTRRRSAGSSARKHTTKKKASATKKKSATTTKRRR
ncbi:hypothetical protein [Hymenobacter elongatus]|uniref:Uncharacterized protein n=1 Tax=Hymenobacter elongatus TaxID=877208 RepID=A0A4Z0PJY3_9BACT|nr:hypothetical protein [Hymenobacter elongatus]TGE14688.1 hypothetical protein E5J99_15000 [Hymenobacter elongatus]